MVRAVSAGRGREKKKKKLPVELSLPEGKKGIMPRLLIRTPQGKGGGKGKKGTLIPLFWGKEKARDLLLRMPSMGDGLCPQV